MLYIVSGTKRRELVHVFGIVLGLLYILIFLGIFFHNHTHSIGTDTDNCLFCSYIRTFAGIAIAGYVIFWLYHSFTSILLPESLILAEATFRHPSNRAPPLLSIS